MVRRAGRPPYVPRSSLSTTNEPAGSERSGGVMGSLVATAQNCGSTSRCDRACKRETTRALVHGVTRGRAAACAVHATRSRQGMLTAANRASPTRLSPARHAFGSRNFRLAGDGTSTAMDMEICLFFHGDYSS